MANSIALIQRYIALLDEVYKQASLTGDLEADASTVRQGAQANEILIPKISTDGLGDYDRNAGYVDGSVSLEWQTKKFDYDRGRRFTVDAMDDEETAGLAFGKLASEFIRTKAAPELDAVRFAKYAAKASTKKSESLTTGDGVCTALLAANNAMDEAEVSPEGRILYITPTLLNMVMALETYKSKSMLEGFSKIVKVPQTRFYSSIDLLSGKIVGSGDDAVDETIGGYKKASAGKNLNFLIVQQQAPLQFTKHVVNKVIPPDANQTSDGWMFFYRAYGLTDAYDNKLAGLYASLGTS